MKEQNVVVGSSVTGITELPENWWEEQYSYYFPINLWSMEDLVGKMLTHVEAMNLPSSVEKANKDLVRQTLWKWYSGVQENSLTSYKGCIGAIYHKGSAPLSSRVDKK